MISFEEMGERMISWSDIDKRRVELREEHPVDLDLLSCHELPHFVGYDLENVSWHDQSIPVDCDYDDPPFHCEITLFQEDEDENVTFRHVGARILDGEIVDWSTDGVPDEMEDEVRQRVLIIYHLLYPYGLTVEDMESKL